MGWVVGGMQQRGRGKEGGGECRGREREIGEKKTYQRRSHQ